MDEQKNVELPWQFSTVGLVLGFIFGFAPLLIALVGNIQFKDGKAINELKSAYNITLVISIILLTLLIMYFVIIGVLISNIDDTGIIY